MTPLVQLGISTCPNDTFAFHGLIERQVDWRGLDFQIELLDIQQLNERLFAGGFDVAKSSFHTALLLADQTVVLPSGSALGFGVGPLLLAARPGEQPSDGSQTTLCPGLQTTATLLFKLFYPQSTAINQVVFSRIMPDLVAGDADFGVCIHEGRFTWQSHGLSLVEDLGTRWETESGCPLPLGGLIARRSMSVEMIRRVQQVIRASIEYGLANPDRCLPTMRRYAQEFDDRVLMRHVELYVNDWTIDLGATGATALAALWSRARSIDLVDSQTAPIEVFSG